MDYVVGFKWFLNDYLSYHLEYNPYFYIQMGKAKENSEIFNSFNLYIVENQEHFYFVFSNSVKAGISIYFE